MFGKKNFIRTNDRGSRSYSGYRYARSDMSSQVHVHLTYVWSACAAVGREDGEGGRVGDTVTLLVMTLVLVAHVLQ